jgi:PEP-CTERM motif
MKKLILAALSTLCAASVLAQGIVIFNNRVTGTIETHVYVGGSTQIQGNGATDTPVGSLPWGSGYTLIGTVGGLSASTTFASLLGAPGFNAPESSLLPASGGGVTTFRTGVASGQIAGTTATFNNILPDSAQATLEMVAWDNSSGLYPTWAQASVAWRAGLIKAGMSGTWNSPVGSNLSAPNLINPTDPTQSVRSFNIFSPAPEPTTLALASLGAAALLISRHRK